MANSLARVLINNVLALPVTRQVSQSIMRDTASDGKAVSVPEKINAVEGFPKKLIPEGESPRSKFDKTVAAQIRHFGLSAEEVVTVKTNNNGEYYFDSEKILNAAKRRQSFIRLVTPIVEQMRSVNNPLIDVDKVIDDFKTSGVTDDTLPVPFEPDIRLFASIINKGSEEIKNDLLGRCQDLASSEISDNAGAKRYLEGYYTLQEKVLALASGDEVARLKDNIAKKLSLDEIPATILGIKDYFIEGTSGRIREARGRAAFAIRENTPEPVARVRKMLSREQLEIKCSEDDVTAEKIFLQSGVLPLMRFVQNEVINSDYDSFKRVASGFCGGEIPHEEEAEKLFNGIRDSANSETIREIVEEAEDLSKLNTSNAEDLNDFNVRTTILINQIRELLNDSLDKADIKFEEITRQELENLPAVLKEGISEHGTAISSIPIVGNIRHFGEVTIKRYIDLVKAANTVSKADGTDADKAEIGKLAMITFLSGLSEAPLLTYAGKAARVGAELLRDDDVRELFITRTKTTEGIAEALAGNGELIENVLSDPALSNVFRKLCMTAIEAVKDIESEPVTIPIESDEREAKVPDFIMSFLKSLTPDEINGLFEIFSKHPQIISEILAVEDISDKIKEHAGAEAAQIYTTHSDQVGILCSHLLASELARRVCTSAHTALEESNGETKLSQEKFVESLKNIPEETIREFLETSAHIPQIVTSVLSMDEVHGLAVGKIAENDEEERLLKLIISKAVSNSRKLIEEVTSDPEMQKVQAKGLKHLLSSLEVIDGELRIDRSKIPAMEEKDIETVVRIISKATDIIPNTLAIPELRDELASAIAEKHNVSKDTLIALFNDKNGIHELINNPIFTNSIKAFLRSAHKYQGKKDAPNVIKDLINSLSQRDIASVLGIVLKNKNLVGLLPANLLQDLTEGAPKLVKWIFKPLSTKSGLRFAQWILNGTLRNIVAGVGGVISLGGLYLIRDDLFKGLINSASSFGFGVTAASFIKRFALSKALGQGFEQGWLGGMGGYGTGIGSAVLGLGSYFMSEHKFKGLLPAFGFGCIGLLFGSTSNRASSIVGFPTRLKGYEGDKGDGLALQLIKNELKQAIDEAISKHAQPQTA